MDDLRNINRLDVVEYDTIKAREGEDMDKKNDIDELMQHYLNFYQHPPQQINLNQGNEFDQLMKQYQNKFDKQIVKEQQMIKQKENERIRRKKEAEQQLKQQRFEKEQEVKQQKHRKEQQLKQQKIDEKKQLKPRQSIENRRKQNIHRKPTTGHQRSFNPTKIIIFIIVIIVMALLSGFSHEDNLDEGNTGYNELPLSDYQDNLSSREVLVSDIALANNLEDTYNAALAANYLTYQENIDSSNVEIEQDESFLTFKNTSEYYVYIQYLMNEEIKNILINPYGSYSEPVYDEMEFTFNNYAFYGFNYPVEFINSIFINQKMTVSEEHFNQTDVSEVMKYYYLKNSLETHENEIVIISGSTGQQGYYGLLNYSDHVIDLYYSDKVDFNILIDNIQDNQDDYQTTITL